MRVCPDEIRSTILTQPTSKINDELSKAKRPIRFMNAGVQKPQKSNTTENNRIFGSLKIDRKPKLREGWEVILKNFMAVKSVKFLW